MSTYPSIYRAKAVQATDTTITAYIPQVFGDTPVVINDFLGPAAPGMGWVFFQAGNPEHPVWTTTGTGSSGNGNGSGTDTDTGTGTVTGGVDEVWVGNDPPTGTTHELWFDPDAPSESAIFNVANPNNALGIVAMGSFLNITTIPSGTTTLTNPIAFTSLVGRRYRLCYQIRVIGVTVGSGINLKWTGSGVDGSGYDLWHSVSGVAGTYSYISGSVMFDGTGIPSSYTMRGQVTGNTDVWLSPAAVSYFYIEDIGPNMSPALPLSPAPPAWIVPTFENGWQNYHADFLPARYRKIGDMVYLRGLISGGTMNTHAFTVPVGFRPPLPVGGSALHLPLVSNSSFGFIHVRGNGQINMSSGSNAWFDLAPISWSVTP